MKSRIIVEGSNAIVQEGDELLHLAPGESIVVSGQTYIATGRTRTENLGELSVKDYIVVPQREYVRLEE